MNEPTKNISSGRIGENLKNPVLKYHETLSLFKNSFSTLTDKPQLNVQAAKESIQRLLDLSMDDEASFQGLSCIREFDEYTYTHCLNVAILAIAFGKKLDFKKEWLADLGMAALFHDVGKLLIPQEILNKKGRLTNEDYEIMKSHPIISVKLLYNLKGLERSNIIRILAAFEHHQRYDQEGYPQLRFKKGQNIFTRVIAICDTYDAMTSNRIYQKRILPEICLKIMSQGYGSAFDPILLKAFITCMGEYPVGSVVRMNNQEIGIVIKYKPTSLMNRPMVKIIKEAHEPRIIDLMHPMAKKFSILCSEFPEDHGINVVNELFGIT